jgi:hypothetical protein
MAEMASKFPRRACSERLKTFFVIIKVFFPIINTLLIGKVRSKTQLKMQFKTLLSFLLFQSSF